MTELKSDTERIQPAVGTGMQQSSCATPQHSLTNLANFIKGKDKEREEVTDRGNDWHLSVCVYVFLKFHDLSPLVSLPTGTTPLASMSPPFESPT